jgi:antitoxin (DNA-binding transcriptional repressor) of toxin-antitoxin stability system
VTKEITVADLKEHLDERLEEVRNGTTLRILEGDRAVMQIEPARNAKHEPLNFINRADRSQRLGDFKFPPMDPIDVDVVELLLELRGNR